jgi:hypothetical protein
MGLSWEFMGELKVESAERKGQKSIVWVGPAIIAAFVRRKGGTTEAQRHRGKRKRVSAKYARGSGPVCFARADTETVWSLV